MFYMNTESILSSFSFSGVMDAVADAMIDLETSPQTLVAPLRTSVPLEENTLMMMPCLSKTDWGLKVLTLFPDNPVRLKPFINGLFLLFDGSDGRPAALLDGRTLTAVRTGGVGGLGVRTLSAPHATRLGIVGAGEQSYWQVRFACSVRPFSRVLLYDTIESKAEICAERIRRVCPELEIEITKSTTTLLKNSDVVITATNAPAPVFENSPVYFEGKTFVGIGSYRPDMREYPDALFRAVQNIYVDTEHAFHETGDLIEPLESGVVSRKDIRSLGDLLSDQKGSVAFESGAFFKSVGYAAFDLFVARYLFRRGVENGKAIDLGE